MSIDMNQLLQILRDSSYPMDVINTARMGARGKGVKEDEEG